MDPAPEPVLVEAPIFAERLKNARTNRDIELSSMPHLPL